MYSKLDLQEFSSKIEICYDSFISIVVILLYWCQLNDLISGEHPQSPQDVLSSLQQAREVQGDAVQEVPGVHLCSRQTPVRQKATGIWRTVKAHLEEEGNTIIRFPNGYM